VDFACAGVMVSSMCAIKRLAIFRAAASRFDFPRSILGVYSYFQALRNIGFSGNFSLPSDGPHVLLFDLRRLSL
jgi:hypothetical protein